MGLDNPSSPSRRRWILGTMRIDPRNAVPNTLSILLGEYLRKSQ